MAQHLICHVIAHYTLGVLLAGFAHAALADDVLRDPTLPPASLSAPADKTINTTTPIQLITISGQDRSAIVRGTAVKVGDRISEGRITDITDSGIWVKSDEGLSELKLFPDVDRRASNPQMLIHRIQR